MRLDEIPAEAWRRAVEDLLGFHLDTIRESPTTPAARMARAANEVLSDVVHTARRIAAEMAEEEEHDA